jgi:hypothetical protein
LTLGRKTRGSIFYFSQQLRRAMCLLTLRGGVSAENGCSRTKLSHDGDEAMHMADYIAIGFLIAYALGGSEGFA